MTDPAPEFHFVPFSEHADRVLAVVADIYGVTVDAIKSPSRLHRHSRARAVAASLMRTTTDATWQEIGSAINRDHSTAIWQASKIDKLLPDDPSLESVIAEARMRLER